MNPAPSTHFSLPTLAGQAPLALFQLTGAEGRQFLHGILSQDIDGLAPGQGVLACLLTPKGKLVSTVFVSARADDLLLLTPLEGAAPFAKEMKNYLAVGNCVLEELADSGALFSMGVPPGAISGVEFFPVTDRLLGKPGHVAVIPTEAVWTSLQTVLGPSFPAGVIDTQGFEILRVEGGVPRLGVDISEAVYPPEINLTETLHASKGCYVGQEVIARLMNFGKPHRQLAGLKLPERIEPARPVFWNDEPAGILTSMVQSPALGGYLGMALLRREASVPGEKVKLQAPSGTVSAEIVSLPLPWITLDPI